MFLLKNELERIRFDINPIYKEIDKIENISVIFKIIPEITFSNAIKKDVLVLHIIASFMDSYIDLEIMGYDAYVQSAFEVTNKENDLKEIEMWLKYIEIKVKYYWKCNCPTSCDSNLLFLEIEKYSNDILNELIEKKFYQ